MAHSEDSVTFLVTFDEKRHLYSRTIEQLFDDLDPTKFYQINRGQLVNIENIMQMHPYLGQRLKLTARAMGKVEELLVSRNRALDFKCWPESQT